MKPISRLSIRHERKASGYSELEALINQNGALVLEGCDAGNDIKEHYGDWDFEYWLTIPAIYKDSVLLHLIKQNFQSVHVFEDWLKEKDIPSEFDSYT